MDVILNLDLVRCFLHVAESGGFTQASQRLHLSQSAVSLKIQRLEALLDRRVFERTSRSLTLTSEGELLLSYARRLIALSDEAVRSVSRRARSGHLNLGIAQLIGQETLFHILSRFRKAHSDITLGVEVGMSGNLLRELEAAKYDVVLAEEGQISNPITFVDGIVREAEISKEPLKWVQSKDSKIDLGLDPLPLAVFPPPCGHRQLIVRLLEQRKRMWRVGYSSSSLPAIQAAIEADWGIGALAGSLITPRMKIIRREAKLPSLSKSTVALYRRKAADGELTGLLTEFLIEELCPASRRENGRRPR